MTMTNIRFDGQVAVITGAAGGIGRAFALELARRGAKVLVNDYGGDRSGIPGNPERAEAVVKEIVAAGGVAAADATAVGTWGAARAIVDHAMSNWGRLDILVNNAGIGLPGSITDVSDEAVDRALDIMLRGPYALMRSAWPIMERQRHGRVINISSCAVFGIGATPSYAAAKAGVIGLTLDTAKAGLAHNILVNAVLPTALTRLTADLPDKDFSEWLRINMPPEKIAAAASYLLSAESSITGKILDVGGGRIARIGFYGGTGYFNPNITAEDLAANIATALDMTHLSPLESVADDIRGFFAVLPWTGGGRGPSEDVDAIVQHGKKFDA